MIQMEVGESSKRKFEAVRISPEEYLSYWPYIDRELDCIPEIWSHHWTKESLYEGGMSGRFQVWGFGPPDKVNLIVFTQVAEFPAARILQVFLAFGNSLEDSLELIEATFERFAKEAECQYCEIFGRKGWQKKLPRFKVEQVIMRCRVSDYRVQ